MAGGTDLVRFRRAAVALAAGEVDEGGSNAPGVEAATALVALAAAGERETLHTLLRPDPGDDEVAWTVACYEIGDLTPSALRDFGEAIAAVTTLADCGQPTHVAAELLTSTRTGITWTAMKRIGDQVSFQLLGPATWGDPADAGSSLWSDPAPDSEPAPWSEPAVWQPAVPGPLESAREGWRALLSEWKLDPTQGVVGPFDPGAGSFESQVLRRLDTLTAQVADLQAMVRLLHQGEAADEVRR